jgi:hypothetical protein
LSFSLNLCGIFIGTREGRDEGFSRGFILVFHPVYHGVVLFFLLTPLSLTFPDPFPPARISTPKSVVV